MGHFPRIVDMTVPCDDKGRKLYRQCHLLVPKGRRTYCYDPCRWCFLQSHSWTRVREDLSRPSWFRCAIGGVCKRKEVLDVGHTIPVHRGGEVFDKDNLRVLCKECHKAKTTLDRQALNGVS
ncbi:hypothetical protein GF342_01580 [Candidatus Woesearchaeota archaeon]|nr:hypothetical protein [Candidatus Woesearchaeota archaeon]